MAKPSELPRFAVDGSDVLATNTTAPSSGQRDTGWTSSQVAVSSYFNRLFAFIYLWLKWLDSITTSDGRLIQNTRTLSIAGSGLDASSTSNPIWATFTLGMSGATQNAVCAIPLPLGKRITAVRAMIVDNATGPTKLRLDLHTVSYAGGGTAVSSSSVSAGSGAAQTLSITGLTLTTVTGSFYNVSIVNTTGSNSTTIVGVEVDYDELV